MESRESLQRSTWAAAVPPSVVQIGTDEVKFFVRRSRASGGYARLRESIREVGLHQPIHVRDIRT